MADELKLDNARKFLGAGTPAGNRLIEMYLATSTLDPKALVNVIVVDGVRDFEVEHYCRVIGSDLEHVLIVLAAMYPPENKAEIKPAKRRRPNEVTNHGEKDR